MKAFRFHVNSTGRGIRDPLRRGRSAGLALVLLAALVGCAGNDEDEYVERPVAELYNEAMDHLGAETFKSAAEAFDEVERQHPYSEWAVRAQIMAAFAHYQANDYDQSILAAKRFIELHRGHPEVAYAYYLVGLCYYEQISDVGRDQKMTQQALDALQEVVRRFSESEYARDAKLKIDLTRNHLAGKEMEVGRFYLGRGQYIAAINRFHAVIENFQTTTHVPEALHRLTEAYLALGVIEEAQAAAAVLGYNYPGSEWYQDSYALLTGHDLRPKANARSWIDRVWKSVF